MPRCLSVLESVSLSICLSVGLPLTLYVCLSVWISVRMQREKEVGLVSVFGVMEGCPELLQFLQGQAPEAPPAAIASVSYTHLRAHET